MAVPLIFGLIWEVFQMGENKTLSHPEVAEKMRHQKKRLSSEQLNQWSSRGSMYLRHPGPLCLECSTFLWWQRGSGSETLLLPSTERIHICMRKENNCGDEQFRFEQHALWIVFVITSSMFGDYLTILFIFTLWFRLYQTSIMGFHYTLCGEPYVEFLKACFPHFSLPNPFSLIVCQPYQTVMCIQRIVKKAHIWHFPQTRKVNINFFDSPGEFVHNSSQLWWKCYFKIAVWGFVARKLCVKHLTNIPRKHLLYSWFDRDTH